MTLIVTTDYAIDKIAAPNLPLAPEQWDRRYQDQYSNVLRLYFNRLDDFIARLMATATTVPVTPGGGTFPVSINGTNTDAFGRLRVSQPYTLFDSQQQYAADPQFDTSTSGTGTTTYNANQASLYMTVGSGGAGSVVRQTYRCFPYQPGKGLLVLATFCMDGSQNLNLTQRVGYFNTQNGVFFQRVDGTYSFVLRSYVTGSASDARTVTQANWNGDKLDGTGASGLTLDPSKSQILWMDFEWLGVGSVRCGFIINGQYIVCHTFNNANEITTTYMTTATLPIRYEITSTAGVAATMKQICSSVVSEGGYEQYSIGHVARRTTKLATIGLTFKPIVSIRLASGSPNAVIVPGRIQVIAITSQNYEIALFKNPTLTGASWGAVPTDSNVEQDTTATAMTGGTIIQTDYLNASGSGGSQPLVDPAGYNWAFQPGVSLAGVSDIITVAIRTIDSATPSGDCYGSLSFWDLTA
jgi:hypothetical protein